jgi:G:T-mismatch repair DNA endonuclease (very short patch repair protein)
METAKFCSKKCFGKWQSKNKRGKNSSRYIDGRTYKKYGYSTLIVWEHELKDIDKLTNRLMEFNGDKLCKK